jgi:hypothetical protein
VSHDIVYLADSGGPDPVGFLQMLDVSDPAHPIALARYEGLAPPVTGVTLAGGRAYVTTGEGLVAVDVSQPEEPVGAGVYQADALPGWGRDFAHGNAFAQGESSLAFVAAGEEGLQVVDVADPARPKVVGGYNTGGHAWALALGDGYAFIADEYNGLRVLDLTDPYNPKEAGYYDPPGRQEFYHGIAVAEGGQQDHAYAYIADGSPQKPGLRIVDITDPANPRAVGFLPLDAPAVDSVPPRVEDVAMAGDIAYVAAGTAGLRVVDVSDPRAAIEVGVYDTPGRVDNLVVADQRVYLVDGDLRIVDVSDPAAPAEVSFYDLPDLAPTPHVAVQGHFVVLSGDGVQVLDVADPRAPIQVAEHPIPSGPVTVAGEMVYVVGDGLYVLLFPAALDQWGKAKGQP